jgi:ATP-dependent Zn protease
VTQACERAAVHEAGHAVLAVKLKTGMRRVSIISDVRSDGRVSGSTLLRGRNGKVSLVGTPQDRLEREIIVALAGYAAEKRGCHDAEVGAAQNDLTHAHQLAWLIFDDDDERDDYVVELNQRAHALVATHWPAIETVAEALMERRELTRRDVVALIEAAEHAGV